MKIPVRLLGVNNNYNVVELDGQTTEFINNRGLVGYTKLTDEEAEKFKIINNENMFLEHYESELVFYNQETVTLTHINVQVDDELYHVYRKEDKDEYSISDVIFTIFNNRNNSKANLNIDVLNYNQTYRDIDKNGVEVVIDTEDLITAGSFTAPQSIVNHPYDIRVPYSREMVLPDDEDHIWISDNMMELLDASGQEYWFTAEELIQMFKLKLGNTAYIE